MKSGLVILETHVKIQIRPDEITPVPLIGTLFDGRADLDFEVKLVLGYCQTRGNWNPFTKEDLAHYASGLGMSNIELSTVFSVMPEWSVLCKQGWIVPFKQYYFVTRELVQYLWDRYPVIPFSLVE